MQELDRALLFHAKFQKWYYQETQYFYNIWDIVEITNQITHDVGYKNQLGVVYSYSGVDHHIYVMSFDTRNQRYWVCGFDEKQLTNPSIRKMSEYRSLFKANEDWFRRNDMKYRTAQGNRMFDLYLQGEDPFNGESKAI